MLCLGHTIAAGEKGWICSCGQTKEAPERLIDSTAPCRYLTP